MDNAGFFGKLPELGDFVTRRLTHAFAQAWDDWLQRALTVSRTQLGQDWLDAYLTSPFWRFILSAGVCGPDAWLGVMMPSVDRVGRHFPLTLALPLRANDNPFALALIGDAWYSRAETLMLSALSQELDFATFDAEVAALPGIGVHPATEDSCEVAADERRCDWRFALPSVDCLGTTYPALLHQLANRAFGPYSVWSTAGSPQVSASLLICAGLPTPQRFAALLDGTWRAHAWKDCSGMPLAELDADLDRTCAGPPFHGFNDRCTSLESETRS